MSGNAENTLVMFFDIRTPLVELVIMVDITSKLDRTPFIEMVEMHLGHPLK